ncbi:MAG: replication-relaxation family protein [Pirellulales bacterium]
MATRVPHRHVTPRDHRILAALDIAPLTAKQLKKLSATWPYPFNALRTARERLQSLSELGLLRIHRYATLYPGQPEQYYVLTREGFQTLHGPDAKPPTKGHFAELAISRQAHSRGLADFLVHFQVAAHRSNVAVSGMYRENSLQLTAGDESVYPDAAFVLVTSDRQEYRFFVEIDCGTERLQSMNSDRTWQRKARVYHRLQDEHKENRFRVLVVAVRAGTERVSNILKTASAVHRDPNRTLFLGVTMFAMLSAEHAATAPIFIDHRGRPQSLVPDRPVAASSAVDTPEELHRAKTA